MSKIDFTSRTSLITASLLTACLLFSACKKKETTTETPAQPVAPSPLPVISTLSVSGLTAISATCGGNVSSEGSSALTMEGICWDVNHAPTTLRSHIYAGIGTGTFTSVMDSLKPNTTYYVRAYATNFSGTAYGNEISFKTQAVWENKTPVFSQSGGGCILVSGSSLFLGSSLGISRTTDNAETWTSINTGLTNTNVKCLFMSGNTMFAGTQGGVFISGNMGDTWSSANAGLTNFNIVRFALKGSSIYAATSNGVFVSTNNGVSWSKLNGLTLTSLADIVVLDNKLYAVSADYGDAIYMSSDDGANWSSFSSFFSNSNPLYQLAVSGSSLFAAASNGFYVYNNSSWSKLLDGVFDCTKTNNNTVLATSSYQQYFYLSNNNGSTFSKFAIAPYFTEDIDANTDYIFAAGSGNFYRLPLK